MNFTLFLGKLYCTYCSVIDGRKLEGNRGPHLIGLVSREKIKERNELNLIYSSALIVDIDSAS